MYLLIDHYDSFVYNLKACFEMQGCAIEMTTCDQAVADSVRGRTDLEGIVFSPGPGRPEDYGNSLAILRACSGRTPILGVCLGHQLIAHAFGAHVTKCVRPMHGKVTRISCSGTGLLGGLPDEFAVTRYHSLGVSRDLLPDCLRIDAQASDGTVMALSHKELPVFGVQFHPESVMSQFGDDIIRNFAAECARRRP